MTGLSATKTLRRRQNEAAVGRSCGSSCTSACRKRSWPIEQPRGSVRSTVHHQPRYVFCSYQCFRYCSAACEAHGQSAAARLVTLDGIQESECLEARSSLSNRACLASCLQYCEVSKRKAGTVWLFGRTVHGGASISARLSTRVLICASETPPCQRRLIPRAKHPISFPT